jgi:hypothetical protein
MVNPCQSQKTSEEGPSYKDWEGLKEKKKKKVSVATMKHILILQREYFETFL